MSFDPTIAHLRQLDRRTQTAAVRMVTHLRLVGIPLTVSSSRRTQAEQRELVRTGRSKTLRSRHLTGEAFDVDVHGFDRSAVPKWWWYGLGQLAAPLGLRWGGNFSGFWDPAHFEDARAIR